MPTKSKSTKSRTKVQKITLRAKALSKEEKQSVKGGYGGFAGGVRVAVADVNGDNQAEIIKSNTLGTTK